MDLEDFEYVGLPVTVNPNTRIPKIGDKVVLTDEFFESMSDGKEGARLARLPYVTVESINRIPQGVDGVYEWIYVIDVAETVYMVGDSYKFLEK